MVKSQSTGRKRDVWPDVLKGFGVVLVVLGHCIQACYSGPAFFDDKLYQFIYSFHMPLFMVVSGYYAWNSIRRAQSPQERRSMIRKKCLYLILPNVVWTLLEYLNLLVTGGFVYRGAVAFLGGLVIGIMTKFWFLWAVLYSFLLVCLMHYKCKDSVWLYILVFLGMFFTPDGLGLMACKYVLPYYLVGFYFNKNKDFLSTKIGVMGKEAGRKRIALVVSGLFFFALVSFFNADSFVYLTGYKLIGKNYGAQLWIDFYRFLVGLCGIIFWSIFWSGAVNWLNLRSPWKYGIRLLAYVGSRGMGIYIVAGIPMRYMSFRLAEGGKPNYWENLAQTVLVLSGSIVIVEILGRIKGVRVLVGK